MREQKRGGWSVADLFLILLLLFSAVGLIGRLRELHIRAGEGSFIEIDVSFRVQGLDPRVVACIAAGDALYTEDGVLVGYVQELVVSGARGFVWHEGMRMEGEWDAAVLCDLSLTVSLPVRVEGTSVYTEALGALLVGKVYMLRTERACLSAQMNEILTYASPAKGSLWQNVWILHEKDFLNRIKYR